MNFRGFLTNFWDGSGGALPFIIGHFVGKVDRPWIIFGQSCSDSHCPEFQTLVITVSLPNYSNILFYSDSAFLSLLKFSNSPFSPMSPDSAYSPNSPDSPDSPFSPDSPVWFPFLFETFNPVGILFERNYIKDTIPKPFQIPPNFTDKVTGYKKRFQRSREKMIKYPRSNIRKIYRGKNS